MIIKAKSHLKHINIKIYSKKKLKKKIAHSQNTQNTSKRPKHPEILQVRLVVFLVPGRVLERHISSVLFGTAQN